MTVLIICPSCFESFEIATPPLSEVPCTVDYDCEVCCRPMTVDFWEESGEVAAEAHGLSE